MVIRNAVIGLLVPVFVLLGGSAGAESGHTRPARNITVNVYGSNNVIATDGSVLTVGRSPVNANTGDVSSGGALGIDTAGSSLRSGAVTTNARYARKPRHGGRGQGTAISGYENHSVRVAGEDQMAVYDDSNLFVNRNGKINGNTGDTDSSGLNAVDVSGSTVRSGDHIEGDESDDDDDDSSSEEKKAVGASVAGRARTRPLPRGQAASSVTDEGESRANGGNALTIGGDGYDDLGVGVNGKRNIAAYDDSNVVIGGTGDVNAQIGDSDTSGAVVMGIANSRLQSGNST